MLLIIDFTDHNHLDHQEALVHLIVSSPSLPPTISVFSLPPISVDGSVRPFLTFHTHAHAHRISKVFSTITRSVHSSGVQAARPGVYLHNLLHSPFCTLEPHFLAQLQRGERGEIAASHIRAGFFFAFRLSVISSRSGLDGYLLDRAADLLGQYSPF